MISVNIQYYRVLKHLSHFCEADVKSLQDIKTGAPTKTVTGKMFNFITSTAQQAGLYYSVEEVDNWFDLKKVYLLSLETHLNNVLKSSNVVSIKNKDLLVGVYEFGLAIGHLAAAEKDEDAALSKEWRKLSEACDQIRLVNTDLVGKHQSKFEDKLVYWLRLIGAAKIVLNNRVNCLGNLQALQKQLSQRIEKRDKLKMSPKAAQFETEVEEWTKKVDEAKIEFEELSAQVKKEIERFEAKKGTKIRKALSQYVQANMNSAVQISDEWKKLINYVQSSSTK